MAVAADGGKAPRLSHLDDSGRVRMVDISGKRGTLRTARARGEIHLSAQARVPALLVFRPALFLCRSGFVNAGYRLVVAAGLGRASAGLLSSSGSRLFRLPR